MIQMPQPSSPTTANAVTFDAWNRMIVVSAGGLSLQRNAYDGNGRRVTMLVSGTLRHSYFSLGWQSLEERLGSSTSSDRQFVWGLRYIDNLILRDCAEFTPSRLYAVQDPNWNVTSVYSSSGTASERYIYAAYGQPTFLSAGFTAIGGSAYDWETLFSGYRFDANTTAYYVRWRVLSPIIGFWLTADPLLEAATGSASSYKYCDGNPIKFTDPDGLEIFCLRPTPILRPTLTQRCLRACPKGPVDILAPLPAPAPEPEPVPPPPPPQNPPGQGMRPPGDCTKVQYANLRGAVEKYCKDVGKLSCQRWFLKWWTCTSLSDNANKLADCANAQRKLMNACFRGGDSDHIKQVQDLEYAQQWCWYKYRKKECGQPEILCKEEWV
jgi:RHS repeat-associated protein